MPCTWMVALAIPALDSASLMNPFTPMCTCIVEKSNYRLMLAKGDSQTTHAIFLTDSMSLLQEIKSGMGSPDRNVLMVDIHLGKLLWEYCPGHAGAKRNGQADRLAGKSSLTSGLLFGKSEVLWSLRHYLWAQSQGHHTTDHLEERGMERGSGDGSVVRAPDSWSKGRGLKSLLKRRENFLLQGQLSVLTLISVSVPPPCYRSST